MIEVFDLNITYSKNEILKEVNLKFESRKVYGIIGPNGSGKTSLLNTISNTLSNYEGQIFIDGILNKEYSVQEFAKKVSYMRQNLFPKFPFSTFELISMGRYSHNNRNLKSDDFDIINKYMTLNNLDDYYEKKITELSGGELQRVFFTKILCQDSKIILIDEGLSNADIYHKINFFNMLRKEASNNKIVIIVIHDLYLARKYCDELILLDNKEVYSYGNSKEVLTSKSLKEVFRVEGDFVDDALVIF